MPRANRGAPAGKRFATPALPTITSAPVLQALAGGYRPLVHPSISAG